MARPYTRFRCDLVTSREQPLRKESHVDEQTTTLADDEILAVGDEQHVSITADADGDDTDSTDGDADDTDGSDADADESDADPV
jgi:hypothetical protein